MNYSHHNTTDERGKLLDELEDKARTQEELILGYFEKYYYVKMSPSQVQRNLGLERVPITSIRRAITNLTDKGFLRKTSKKVMGMYGRKEYCWAVIQRQGNLF